MKFTLLLLALCLLLGSSVTCAAAPETDPLTCLLRNSDFVVVGEVTSDALVVMDEAGVARYQFDFKVTEVLSDKVIEEKVDKSALTLDLRHDEFPEDMAKPATWESLPYMKEGSKCILFLDREKHDWKASDRWFSMQPYNKIMALFLKRQATKEAPKPEVESP